MAVVLIADDSRVVRRMLGAALRGAGHEVIEVADGAAAVHAADERELDLVITDLTMPRLGGLEVVTRLRALPGFGERPILVITTKTGLEIRNDARSRGASGWIAKPFSDSDLLAAVARVLGGAR